MTVMNKEKLVEEFLTLREMATRWKPSYDGGKWPMYIKIGSGVHGDGQSEHGIPHAHFESKDGEIGVFSIQNENAPENYNEIIVIEGEISVKWKKILVEWANSKSKSYPDYNNWYVARDDWNVNRGTI
jgi:hypothetical protein